MTLSSFRFLLVVLLLLLCPASCHASVDSNNDSSASMLLLEAAMTNNVENLAKALQEVEGVDINVQDDSSGQTPLMAAVLRGHFEIVEILLEHGASPEIGEKDGYTPAHGAGFQGRADVMRLLHTHGIDVKNDFHSKDGYLPLHRACWGREQRHTDTVQTLLELGVHPNVPSKNGRTCKDMTQNQGTLDVLRKYTAKHEL